MFLPAPPEAALGLMALRHAERLDEDRAPDRIGRIRQIQDRRLSRPEIRSPVAAGARAEHADNPAHCGVVADQREHLITPSNSGDEFEHGRGRRIQTQFGLRLGRQIQDGRKLMGGLPRTDRGAAQEPGGGMRVAGEPLCEPVGLPQTAFGEGAVGVPTGVALRLGLGVTDDEESHAILLRMRLGSGHSILWPPVRLQLESSVHDPLVSIALILVLGVGAQWLAWRIRVPSILLLLLAGMLIGPLSTFLTDSGAPVLDPDDLFQDLLLPLVSLSVGLILYEGGLTLSLSEISDVGVVIRRLVTVGAFVSWTLAGVGAYFILGLDWRVAALMGAILVVTGPTVIGPLLNHIRPQGRAGPVLRWEGIVIDPIGALLAVLVFEALFVGQKLDLGFGLAMQALMLTVLVGGVLGVVAAFALAAVLKRFWVPDSLQNPVSVLLVVAIFVLSNAIQHESGLLATTVMGIVLANQKGADIRHIIEFKENLRVLLISALFITLGARMSPEDLAKIGWGSLAFVVFLIVLVRPVSVWLATLGSGLNRSDRLFLACVAPRGIVAAAVASVFAISLEGAGDAQASEMVPQVFSVILGTVAFYGLAAGPIARRLGLSSSNPQGVLFIGAPSWARDIATALSKRGFKMVMLDTNYGNVRAARLAGLTAVYGNGLHDETLDKLDLAGVGRVFSVTPNDEVNVLTSQRFMRLFDRAHVYRIGSPRDGRADRKGKNELPGRRLFGPDITYGGVSSRMGSGWVVKVTSLSDEFTYDDFRTLYGSRALVLFVIGEGNKLTVATDERPPDPQPGQSVVALVNPDELLMI